MQFTYKLKMNPTNKILKDHGLDKNGKVTRHLRDTVDRLSDPFVPTTIGSGAHLRSLKRYPTNNTIKYIAPYAKYQYYGKLMLAKNGSSWAKKGEKKILTSQSLKYHTSGTGAKWEQLMLQRRKKDLENDIQNYIKRGF